MEDSEGKEGSREANPGVMVLGITVDNGNPVLLRTWERTLKVSA